MADFNAALSEAINGEAERAEHVTRKRPTHPKGWEPGFEWDGRKGWIVTDPTTGRVSPEFDQLLTELGFDSERHEIVGPIQVRRWQQRPGDDYLYYHRATVALRSEAPEDVDAFVGGICKRKPRNTSSGGGSAALVVNLADWQVGKDDGDGVQGTHDRLADMIGKVEDRWRDLRKLSVPLAGLFVNGMGDLGEACSGHYAQQQFRVVLNERDQRKVIRWAIDSALDAWARFAPWVAVKAVGGNHGENREGGKSYTDFADNRDVAVFEDVAFAYSKNPDRYGHVSFALPNDDLSLTFEFEGTIVGLAHGHQAGLTSGDPRTKIHNWWKGQMDGQHPIGDADILVTAHYHHPWMIRRGSRTHFGCPAMDGGSDWFRNQTGLNAPPGTLTFVLDPRGWSALEVL